jgi:hypothetical protein
MQVEMEHLMIQLSSILQVVVEVLVRLVDLAVVQLLDREVTELLLLILVHQ